MTFDGLEGKRTLITGSSSGIGKEIALAFAQAGATVGIHFGEIIAINNDIYGDDVNIASRLENLSPEGGICISSILPINICISKL